MKHKGPSIRIRRFFLKVLRTFNVKSEGLRLRQTPSYIEKKIVLIFNVAFYFDLKKVFCLFKSMKDRHIPKKTQTQGWEGLKIRPGELPMSHSNLCAWDAIKGQHSSPKSTGHSNCWIARKCRWLFILINLIKYFDGWYWTNSKISD